VSSVLDMGGYAAFVWPAYGVTLLGLGAVIALTWRAYRQARARLAAVEGT
jgi:heme exporter protein D